MDSGADDRADGGDDGVELAYHRPGGRGPVAVLCHGITDSGRCWSRVADRLRERYDVVLADARGHGHSPHRHTYAFSARVRDLERLLDHLAAAPVVLVGHSMAGPHVTAVAGWHDDDLRPWAEAAATVDPRVPTWLRSPEIDGWREDLDGVGCPVLLMTGDRDVTVAPGAAAEAAAACPTHEQVHLEGAGHSVRDRFESYTAALVGFLDRVHEATS